MSLGQVTRLVSISRNVADLGRSVAFYRDRLGFVQSAPVSPMECALASLLGFPGGAVATQRMTFGTQAIDLVEVGPDARPYPADSTSADLWFQHMALRCLDIDAACERLHRTDSGSPAPVVISHGASGGVGPVTLPARSGGATALKLRDPDGHPLELIALPRNGRSRPAVCNSIDHCAISVSDARRSIAFYTDILGLPVSARQINSGEEQCALDALSDDVVDVIALEPSLEPTPHIELLAYRSPAGRALNPGAIPFDIASDRLVMTVTGFSKIVNSRVIEPYLLNVHEPMRTALLQDPDGHFLVLAE